LSRKRPGDRPRFGPNAAGWEFVAVAKKNRRRPAAGPTESQVSVAVTVAWMLSVLTTLACASVAAIVWLVARNRAGNESALVFVGLMHFSAIVTGATSLLLLGVMLKVRREPPPLGLVVFSVILAGLPIAAALLD
jgi:hypothetical protein